MGNLFCSPNSFSDCPYNNDKYNNEEYNKEINEYITKFVNNNCLVGHKYFIPKYVLREAFVEFLINNNVDSNKINYYLINNDIYKSFFYFGSSLIIYHGKNDMYYGITLK